MGKGMIGVPIIYDERKKDLPSVQLHQLFLLAGWSDGEEDPYLLERFNAPFLHSTLVISAWEGERLVGTTRVLSDTIIRSILYDLVVHPDYRSRGIGRELVRRCMATYPDSEWFLQTTQGRLSFYQQLGFQNAEGVFLRMPSKYIP